MGRQPRAAMYTIDLQAGYHAYASVEGVGECRQNFMQLVEKMASRTIDIVVVMKVQFLFIDTSPMWIEKFITTAKRHRIKVADATTNTIYDLNQPAQEAALRKCAETEP